MLDSCDGPGSKASGRLGSERFDRLLRGIYDCARDPAGWPKVLSELCVLVEGSGGLIATHPMGGGTARLDHAFNVAERFRAAYADTVTGALRSAPGSVISGPDVDAAPGGQGADFHACFLRPQGFREALYGVIAATGASVRVVALLRREESPPFGPRQRSTLERVLPHLAQAHALRREVDVARAELSHFLDILDDLPLACLIVDRGGRVRYGNARAHALLRLGHGLVSVSGRLATANGAETRKLRQAIERTATAPAGGDDFVCHHVVVRQSPDGTPLLLHLRPVRGRKRDTPTNPTGLVAIICKGEPDPREDPMRDFAQAYSLTGSEAHLVSLLAEGCDLMQAAARLGVTKNTARTHMRRVYSKIDAHRQVDLLRLIGHLRLG